MKELSLRDKVEMALDEVRPHLKVDGGDVEIHQITEDNEVQVKWLGACQSCSMSAMTLRAGIEHTIVNAVPEITKVTAINSMEGAYEAT